jgi:NDP-sugar pyrophosphorylase family protein
MQIIIPMSGFGERFRRVGYEVPKPLIEIEGKPIIAHVIDLFPGESNFVFVCNEDHLQNKNYDMEDILKKYCPTGRIVGIAPHKLGPVHAVNQVENIIDLSEPTIVNYCDFSCLWDWNHFKNYVIKSGCDGAIPSYKGFHPHSLGTTNYAYIKEKNGIISDIQEKQPFTDNRMEEYASSGTYYFASAQIMFESFEKMIDKKLSLNGEYYVSLAYKILLESSNSVMVYPLQHFMQWGTPEDVHEYNYWSKTFKKIINIELNQTPIGSKVIPMAGLGERFAKEGYKKIKPLIEVSGLPMVIQASNDLPKSEKNVFVVRSDMPDYKKVISELGVNFPGGIIKSIDTITEGQACTADIGVKALKENFTENIEPMIIGTCDNGAIYDYDSYKSIIDDPDTDIVVWGIRGYANAIRNPEMFGWIDSENGKINSISVKKPLLDKKNDPIVLGTFTFKSIDIFEKVISSLYERNGRINGEFYMDSCIEDAIKMGYNCRLFEVDSYLCWGTPNDMLTFNYWQSCFHQWDGHSYSIFEDNRVPDEKKSMLKDSYVSEDFVKSRNI